MVSRAPLQKGKRPKFLCVCDCGNIGTIQSQNLTNGTSKSCGCLRNEEFKKRTLGKHHLWKGGRSKDAGGYIRIRTGHDDTGKPIRIMEHRVVMEKFLNRALLDSETVHHKNGIRTDNRLENLELKAAYHGSGQSIPDLVTWAEDVLKRYAPEKLK